MYNSSYINYWFIITLGGNMSYYIYFARHYNKYYEKFKTEEEALAHLKLMQDNDKQFFIAITNAKTKKIVWYNDYLTEEECLKDILNSKWVEF
jgi:hypothetical protein